VELPLVSCRTEEAQRLLDTVQDQVAQLSQQQQQQHSLLMRVEDRASTVSELRDEFRAGLGDMREQLNSHLRQVLEDQAVNIVEMQSQLKTFSQHQPAATQELQQQQQQQQQHQLAIFSHGEAIAQLRLRLRELPLACSDRLASIGAQQNQHAQALEDLRAGLDEASFASGTARAALHSRLQQHSEEMRELQQHLERSECCNSSTTHAAVAAAIAEGHATEGAALMAAALGLDLEHPATLPKSDLELEADVRELLSRCNALQAAFEQATSMAASRMDEQLLEVLAKIDRLQADHPELIAKVEENEVRLGIAVVRLESQEMKTQGCLDRLDRAPTADQVRRLCREEVQRRLEEISVTTLMSDVDLQARAIQELRDRLQEVCDVVSYG